jgi:hypothetical protein
MDEPSDISDSQALPETIPQVLSYATPERRKRGELFLRAFHVAVRFGAAVFIIGFAVASCLALFVPDFSRNAGQAIALLGFFWLAESLYCVAIGTFVCWIRLHSSKPALEKRNVWIFAIVFIMPMPIILVAAKLLDPGIELGKTLAALFVLWYGVAPCIIGFFLMRRQITIPLFNRPEAGEGL